MKIEIKNFAVQGERLSAREPVKAMQQSELHRNEDAETGGTETASSLLERSRGNSLGTREQFLNRKVVEPRGVKAVSETTKEKSSLIDSNPVMGTMAEAGEEAFAGHRDRLSEKRSSLGPCNSRVCIEKEDAESSRNACSRAKFGMSNKSTSSRLVAARCAFVRRRASRFVSAGRTVQL